jgi:hypothetical protein
MSKKSLTLLNHPIKKIRVRIVLEASLVHIKTKIKKNITSSSGRKYRAPLSSREPSNNNRKEALARARLLMLKFNLNNIYI